MAYFSSFSTFLMTSILLQSIYPVSALSSSSKPSVPLRPVVILCSVFLDLRLRMNSIISCSLLSQWELLMREEA